MIRLILGFILFLQILQSYGQIVSQFNWDSNPVTNAVVGPNATSVSGSATSDVGGVGGTNGLNAGTPKADINMVIPGSPTFDINGIDVSFDYQREESTGTFFQRGSSLVINGCANLSVSFRVDDGSGGYNTVTSGNVYAIPNDDVFRNYRFIYLPVSGEAFLMVDGLVVWSNDGPDNRNMYWTGSGNVTIGSGIDGTGNNDTFMDNLIIGDVFNSGLPIELLQLAATKGDNERYVDLNWTTASEQNNDYYSVQKSNDGQSWSEIGTVSGAGNSTTQLHYTFRDENPYSGISYYRLEQFDFDGESTYSPIVSTEIHNESELLLYPNPASKNSYVQLYLPPGKFNTADIFIYSMDGRLVQMEQQLQGNSQVLIYIDSAVESGTYFIVINEEVLRLVVRE